MIDFPYRIICNLDSITFDKLQTMSEKEGISIWSMLTFCINDYFHRNFRSFESKYIDSDGGYDRG